MSFLQKQKVHKSEFFHLLKDVGVVGLIIGSSMYFSAISLAAASWPAASEWNIITGNGSPLIDRENRGTCTDPTNGGASPSQENDIGSQAKCSSAPRYNPGFVDEQFSSGLQPSATAFNTFSAANHYRDANSDSNACTNLSDDTFFFRTRIADTPLQNNATNGFKNSYWWATLDVNADDIVDFYVRVNGNGNKTSETLTVIHEESTGVGDPANNDPTGEPVIVTYTNPIDLGLARGVVTPDNGTVGDGTEYFIDWQVPVTDLKTSGGSQVLCYGNNLVLTNYSTSDANQPLSPFQKDFIQASGTVSDVITLTNPEYTLTKTASDVNGGTLYPGDEVEYTVTATNIGSNLADFVLVDPMPVGATYVASSMEVSLGATTYTLSDASGAEATCPTSTHCEADYNVTNAGAVTLSNDWLYAGGSSSPQYDTITFKFSVTFAADGTFSNQATGSVRELPDQLSDDPAVGGTADPTDVTVSPTPPPDITDLEITKTDGVTSVMPGDSVTYTITVTNNGPNDATGATVTDSFDVTLSNINWSCSASASSSCTGLGSGDINDAAVNLLVGGTATYTVTADTDDLATGLLVNTASVTVPGGMTETDNSNNSATDSDTYTPTDFGDAPDPSYPTLFASNGARHTIVSGQYLGASADAEAEGQQSPTATGDDVLGSDDEDGVSFTSTLIQGNTATVNVTASVSGNLDAWVDFDGNGSWADAGEQVFTSQALSAGVNNLNIPVPMAATAGTTYARFRFSQAGALSYTGAAPDGEVEDYAVTILTTPDLSTSTKADDDVDNDVTGGQTITYTITVNNSGGSDATGVDVDDVMDANMEDLSVTGFSSCGLPVNTSTANPAELHLANISVTSGGSCTITFTAKIITFTAGGTMIGNTVTISAADQGGSGATPSSDTLTVDTVPNLSTSTKADDDADNDVGNAQTITYTVTINNTGNGTGTGITVDDVLDADLENLVVVSTMNCGTPTDTSTSTELHLSTVDVAVGTPCEIVFTADVTAGAPGSSTIPNTVTISAASEGGSGAVKSSDLLVVGGSIDFSTASKSHNDGDNILIPGDTVTYTISIPNTGNTNATAISVEDLIDADYEAPTNFSYLNCGTPTDDFSSPPTLLFSNIDINASETCEISYDLQLTSPIIDADPESTTLGNSATISPANGSGTLIAGTLLVDVTPDLSTSVQIDDDFDNNVIPGQTVTYTLGIENTGDGTGTGIHVNNVIDTNFGNLQILSISDCGANFSTTLTTNEPPVLDITGLRADPGTTCIITFSVDVDTGLSEGTTLPMGGTVDPAAQGGNGATLVSDTLTISSVPFLIVTKTTNDTDNTVTPGQVVTYTITIDNSGNGTATGISATDTVDPSFGDPVNFSFSGCGGLASQSYVFPTITFTDLSVAVPLDCTITYQMTVDPFAFDGTNLDNGVDVSAADEGGNDPALTSASTLTVSVPATEPDEPEGGGRPDTYVPPEEDVKSEEQQAAKVETRQLKKECLAFDPNRNLTFTDINEEKNHQFQKAAMILRNSYIVDSKDYVLSGYQSFTQDIGQRTVGLDKGITRLEWAKTLMLAHCLPIRNAATLRNITIKGNTLPAFDDLPLTHNGDKNHDWYVDNIYSAAYYEILDGETASAEKVISVGEGIKMAVKTGKALRQETVIGQTEDESPREQAARLSNNESISSYYTAARDEGIFANLTQLPERTDTQLKRNEAFINLVRIISLRNMYTHEDSADIQNYLAGGFLTGGKTNAPSVLGASNFERLLQGENETLKQQLAKANADVQFNLLAAMVLLVAGYMAGRMYRKKMD